MHQVTLPATFVGLLFVALGLVFLVLAIRESVKNQARATPSRKAWLRVGVIFTAIGLFLYAFQRYHH